MEYEDKTVGIITDTVDVVVCEACGCEIDTVGLEPFMSVECPDCNAISAVPAKLGPFHLINLIGTGGMGGVYEAKDESLGRRVAIKVMLKSLGSDEKFVHNFKHEAQSVARLNHPNIAQIYSFGTEKGQPYIVMELVSGEKLDKMIECDKRIPQGLVMKIGLEIAQGLHAADEAGLIHGDIKPENILLDKKGHAKLVDFGIATAGHQSQQDGIWGTPYYIAPEKLKRQKVDFRADMYSLGGTLYHAVAGVPPFEGETPVDVVKARLQHPPKPLKLRCSGIDPHVEKIITRMLQLEPSRRYPTYGSLVSDIRKFISSPAGKKAMSTIRTKKKTGKLRVARGGSAGPDTGRGGSVPSQKKTISKISSPKTGSRPAVTTSRKTIRTKRSTSAKLPPKTGVSATAKEDPRQQGKGKGQKETPPKKKKSKAGGWIFMTILILGAIGGAAYFWHTKKEEDFARRREYITLTNEKGKSAKTYQEIKIAVSDIVVAADSAQTYIDDVSKAVLFVTGTPLKLPDAPAKKSSTTTNKVAEAKSPKKGKSATKETATPAQQVPPADEGPGFMTREQPEANRNAGADAAKPEAKPEMEPEPVEIEADPLAGGDPRTKEILPYAQNTLLYSQRLINNGKKAKMMWREARDLRKEADQARTSIICIEKNTGLSTIVTRLKELKKDTDKHVDSAKEKHAKTLKVKKEVEEEREAQRLAQLQADKDAADAADAQKAAEERAALLQNELELTITAKEAVKGLVKNNDFKKAIDNLTGQLAEYQTEEAKAVLQLRIDQIKAMESLRQFLIVRINKKPFKWGWGFKTSSSRDVIGADDDAIKITGKDIPWSSVNSKQMIKFIKHYLAPESTKRESIAVLGKQHMNVAVYCLLNGGAKLADDYARKATSYNVEIEKEVSRLVVPEE